MTRIGLTLDAGLVAHLAPHLGLRLAGSATGERARANEYAVLAAGEGSTYDGAINAARADLALTVFYRQPVWGTLALQPTVGLFVAGTMQTAKNDDAPLSAQSSLDYADGGGGVELGLPILIRLFGTDVGLTNTTRLSLGDLRRFEFNTGAQLHVNF